MLGKSLNLNLSEPEPEPDWIVDHVLERGTVMLFAADSGAGKTMLMMDMAACIIQQRPWLGFPTHGKRVMFIDNENHPRIVRKRLRMFGAMPDDEDKIRYFNRFGVQLGSGSWLERTMSEINDFQPDVVMLDTVSSTTKPQPPPDGSGSMGGGNEAIAHLYATVLRVLAGTERAVIAQHHQKKPSKDSGDDPRYKVLGGMQWYGQADSMLSLKRNGNKFIEGDVTRFPVELELVKDRDGNHFKLPLAISSRREDDRLVGWIERMSFDA